MSSYCDHSFLPKTWDLPSFQNEEPEKLLPCSLVPLTRPIVAAKSKDLLAVLHNLQKLVHSTPYKNMRVRVIFQQKMIRYLSTVHRISVSPLDKNLSNETFHV